jgi:uncharacterized protein (TIGR03089 family)
MRRAVIGSGERGRGRGSEGRGGGRGVTEAVLVPLLATDPHRPRLTWYGMGRTELSTASLANWAAKVAGLLDVELGAARGDDAVIAARPSWQLMPVALGTWWAGMNLVEGEVGGIAAAVFLDAGTRADVDGEEFVVSPHPFGAPVGEIAPGQMDFTGAVLHQSDRYTPRPAGAGEEITAAVPWHGENPLSVADLESLAREGAENLGSGTRLVVPIAGHTVLDLAVTLLATLAADGSLVVVDVENGHDVVAVAGDERASASAWSDVPGLPRAAAWEDHVTAVLGRGPA